MTALLKAKPFSIFPNRAARGQVHLTFFHSDCPRHGAKPSSHLYVSAAAGWKAAKVKWFDWKAGERGAKANSHDFGRGALHFPALFPIRAQSSEKSHANAADGAHQKVTSHARQSVFEEIKMIEQPCAFVCICHQTCTAVRYRMQINPQRSELN